MDGEQRFSFAITAQNLKQNKHFIVLALVVLSLTGLYLGLPLAVIEKTVSSNLQGLIDLHKYPVNITNVTKEDFPETSFVKSTGPVKWGFDSVTPTTCSEDRVIILGEGVYLSVCFYKGNIIIDIRKFTGSSKVGLKPTLVGIGLNKAQWNDLTAYVSLINEYINDLS
jgi:hypothetical protein